MLKKLTSLILALIITVLGTTSMVSAVKPTTIEYCENHNECCENIISTIERPIETTPEFITLALNSGLITNNNMAMVTSSCSHSSFSDWYTLGVNSETVGSATVCYIRCTLQARTCLDCGELFGRELIEEHGHNWWTYVDPTTLRCDGCGFTATTVRSN